MAATLPNIEKYKEGATVPGIIHEYIVVTDEIEYNISDMVKKEPSIVDSSDYAENSTYINEISLVLDNEDGLFSNKLETGLFDVDSSELFELIVNSYIDCPGGYENKAKTFGGWIDLRRMKPDSVKLEVSIVVKSYFGRADEMSGLNLTTQYIDNTGMILFKAGIWVISAAVSGYELKNGIHKISTQSDGGTRQVKLDDGEWTNMNYPATTIISNAECDQKIEVAASSLYFIEDVEVDIVVKEEGEQYPYSYYFFASAIEIVQKCFELLDVSDEVISDYKISSYDDRRLISYLPAYTGQFMGNPISVVSDGNDKVYISLIETSVAGSVQNASIWLLDLTEKTFTKKYEASTYGNNYNAYELELNSNGTVLYAFFRGTEAITTIQRFALPGFSRFNIAVDTDIYDFTRITYCKEYDIFLMVAERKIAPFTKHVYGIRGAIDFPVNGGRIFNILEDPLILENEFSWVYENNGEVYFYFIRYVTSIKRLYRIKANTYASWGLPEYVIDWIYTNEISAVLNPQEDKIILYEANGNAAYVLDHVNKTVTADILPDGVGIAAGTIETYEASGEISKVYFISVSDEGERFAYIENDTYYEGTRIPEGMTMVQGGYTFARRKRGCIVTDEDDEKALIFASWMPGTFLRFSKTFLPTIFWEYETSGKTIKQVLQEIANNYLAFIRIDVNKKGYFVQRASYHSSATVMFKPEYVKGRITEKVYNEKFDGVEVIAGNIRKHWGDNDINGQRLEVSLDLIPPAYAKDFSKWFYEYYSIERKLMSIKYIPTFFDSRALDQADLSLLYDTEQVGTNARIHFISPRKAETEFKILIDKQ